MTLQKGAKVKIRNSEMACFTGRIATVDHSAPDKDNTTVYRLRIGDMVLPGWYGVGDLEPLYRPYTTLIIDFEGTLSDTSEGVIKSMANALEHFSIQFDEQGDLSYLAGLDPAECFCHYFMMKPAEVTTATQLFNDHYASIGIYGQKIHPGMLELLDRLRKEGFSLVAFSMKPVEDLRFSLEYLEVADYFDSVCGIEILQKGFDETQLLDSLLKSRAVGGDRSEFVFIGDSADDMRAAAANGIDSIGVLWGFGEESVLSQAGAKHLARDQKELAGFL